MMFITFHCFLKFRTVIIQVTLLRTTADKSCFQRPITLTLDNSLSQRPITLILEMFRMVALAKRAIEAIGMRVRIVIEVEIDV